MAGSADRLGSEADAGTDVVGGSATGSTGTELLLRVSTLPVPADRFGPADGVSGYRPYSGLPAQTVVDDGPAGPVATELRSDLLAELLAELPEDNGANLEFTLDEYLQRVGRPVSEADIRTVERGCVGVTVFELGLPPDSMPPKNLVFSDPEMHAEIAAAQEILAPAEIANGRVEFLREAYARADAKFQDMVASGTDAHTLVGAQHALGFIWSELDNASSVARAEWAAVAGEYAAASERAVNAKLISHERTLARVLDYADRVEAVLAKQPANKQEFLELASLDERLAQLDGLSDALPPDLSDCAVGVFAHHFWSGQDNQADWREGRYNSAMDMVDAPDKAAFAPLPGSGQVPMSGDRGWGKLGYVNYDYGVYNRERGTWTHANVGAEEGPMRIYESTRKKFATGYIDFDREGIGFVVVPKRRTESGGAGGIAEANGYR